MARPKKKIDYELAAKLAHIHCTQEEIAGILDLSVRTLQRDREFCHIYKKGTDNGKMVLRRYQFKMAETNATMAIWLGKQILKQKDTDNESQLTDTEIQKLKSIANSQVDNNL